MNEEWSAGSANSYGSEWINFYLLPWRGHHALPDKYSPSPPKIHRQSTKPRPNIHLFKLTSVHAILVLNLVFYLVTKSYEI